MRWKEQEFAKSDEDCGLTIAGFYYICLCRQTGDVEGTFPDIVALSGKPGIGLRADESQNPSCLISCSSFSSLLTAPIVLSAMSALCAGLVRPCFEKCIAEWHASVVQASMWTL